MFGNPDGGSSFQVGIALPTFLLNKKNRAVILAIFFLVLLVFFPLTVWLWYSEKEKYDSYGVNRTSIYRTLYFFKNDNIIVKNVLEMVSSSEEMRPIISASYGQGAHLKKILTDDINPVMAKEK